MPMPKSNRYRRRVRSNMRDLRGLRGAENTSPYTGETLPAGWTFALEDGYYNYNRAVSGDGQVAVWQGYGWNLATLTDDGFGNMYEKLTWVGTLPATASGQTITQKQVAAAADYFQYSYDLNKSVEAGTATPAEIQAYADRLNEESEQIALNAGQAEAARVLMMAPGVGNRAMTVDEFVVLFRKPYEGEDLMALTEGARVQYQQDVASQNTGLTGFINQGLPMILASVAVGGMVGAWATATGAPAYGPLAAGQDLLQQAGIELPWGTNVETGGLGIDSGPYEDAAGNLYDPAPGSYATDYSSVISPPSGGWENDLGNAWENAVADSANQNMALAEASGQVPPGTLAQTVGESAAKALLSDAQQILAAGNPVIPGGSGGSGSTSTTTSGSGVTATDVLKTAGAAIPVIGAGAGLVRQLTASDGTSREIPWLATGGQSNPDLYGSDQPSTLADTLKKFPWWIVAVGAAILTS